VEREDRVAGATEVSAGLIGFGIGCKQVQPAGFRLGWGCCSSASWRDLYVLWAVWLLRRCTPVWPWVPLQSVHEFALQLQLVCAHWHGCICMVLQAHLLQCLTQHLRDKGCPLVAAGWGALRELQLAGFVCIIGFSRLYVRAGAQQQ
jgi:hypothetical protein